MLSPADTSFLKTVYSLLEVSCILINDSRFNECCNIMRCIRREVHLFDNTRRYTRIAHLSPNVAREYIFHQVRLRLAHEIESDIFRFRRSISPPDRFWRDLPFLDSGLLDLLLFLLLAPFIVVVSLRHQLAEQYPRELVRPRVHLFHLGSPRDLGEHALQVSDDAVVVDDEVFLFQGFLGQELHQFPLVLVHFYVFTVPLFVLT